MFRVQVSHTQTRTVPVYKWEWDPKQGKHVRGAKIEDKEVSRTRVMFSGSEAAFDIWKKTHHLPADAEIKRWPKKNR